MNGGDEGEDGRQRVVRVELFRGKVSIEVEKLLEQVKSTNRFLSRDVVLDGGSADPTRMAYDGILSRLHKCQDLWPHLHVFDVIGVVDQFNQLSDVMAQDDEKISFHEQALLSRPRVLTISKSSKANTRSLTVCASSMANSSFSRIITASLFPMI